MPFKEIEIFEKFEIWRRKCYVRKSRRRAFERYNFYNFFLDVRGQNDPQVSNFSKKNFDSPSTLLLPLTNGVEQKKFRENIPTNKEVIGKKRFSPSPQYTRRPFNAIEGSERERERERERVLTHSVSVSLSLSLSLSPLSYCETQRKVAFRPVVQSVYRQTHTKESANGFM